MFDTPDLYDAFFQHMIWYGPTSETALCREGRKLDKNIPNFRAEEDNQ